MMFRVSHVEAFRRYQQDEDATLEDLLATLRGEKPASERMEAGTAFHRALELASAGEECSALAANGHTFYIVGDMSLELPEIRELRAGKTYQTPDGPVTVSGQVDAIIGRTIHDHKTTSRFDPDRYLEGCQWKFYLDIFGADLFRWNVFEIKATDDPLTWDVFAQHTLEQYRYPDLGRDCGRLVADLAAFTRSHLPERIRELAVA